MVMAIGLIGWSTYRSWRVGPWDISTPTKAIPVATVGEKQTTAAPRGPVSTDVIVSKNLFDPERGAGATRDAEESSRSSQRIRNMILVGTVIIGNNRTAILQDGANPSVGPAAPPAQPTAPMRLKLGDNVEGYRLEEIADRKVVFTKDAARVEVMLDYFRKVEVGAPRAAPTGQFAPPGAVAVPPRVIPNLPRRGRVPVPGSPTPDS
jgi:hypothetical protein